MAKVQPREGDFKDLFLESQQNVPEGGLSSPKHLKLKELISRA